MLGAVYCKKHLSINGLSFWSANWQFSPALPPPKAENHMPQNLIPEMAQTGQGLQTRETVQEVGGRGQQEFVFYRVNG